MKYLLQLIFLTTTLHVVYSQEFYKIWTDIPNSKGIKLEKNIVNDRITQVDTPGLYAFFPSPEENNGSAVIICPGGGYKWLAYNISGFQIAKWFNSIGVNAFVLIYRLPASPDLIIPHITPLQDAQRAARFIRSNAEKWKINPEKIGIMGTSAGGHLASTLSTHSEDVSSVNDELDKFSFLPNFQILISPVITMLNLTHPGSKNVLLGDNPSDELIKNYSNENNVTFDTPPAFIVHAVDDKTVSIYNSLNYYKALIEKSVSASLHIFPKGGHSITLRNNPGSTNLWTLLCEMWLKEMRFIQ